LFVVNGAIWLAKNGVALVRYLSKFLIKRHVS
jgi:hypothetical protein